MESIHFLQIETCLVDLSMGGHRYDILIRCSKIFEHISPVE